MTTSTCTHWTTPTPSTPSASAPTATGCVLPLDHPSRSGWVPYWCANFACNAFNRALVFWRYNNLRMSKVWLGGEEIWVVWLVMKKRKRLDSRLLPNTSSFLPSLPGSRRQEHGGWAQARCHHPELKLQGRASSVPVYGLVCWRPNPLCRLQWQQDQGVAGQRHLQGIS